MNELLYKGHLGDSHTATTWIIVHSCSSVRIAQIITVFNCLYALMNIAHIWTWIDT